jgi:DNA-directed RNA polymerase specialized sigma24 family protein
MGDDATDQFEEHRDRLRALALRMLGTGDDAEDAVQETWVRFDRVDPSASTTWPGGSPR